MLRRATLSVTTGDHLTSRPLQHQFAHARSIRLAGHRLHDRTDHRTSRLHLAVTDLLEHIGLSGQRFVLPNGAAAYGVPR